MKKIKQICLFAYAFYLFYLPNYGFITPILQPSFILFILAIMNLILLNKKLISFIKKGKLYNLIIWLLIFVLYLFIVNVTNEFDAYDLASNIVFSFNIVNYISLIIWFDKLYSKSEMSEFIVKIGLIQAVISFSMLLFQPLKNIANTLYINSENPGTNLLGITSTRIFGFGGGYTVALPFVQALIAIIALQIFISNGKGKYFIFSILLIISSALNNRTGLMIYSIVLSMYIVKFFFNKFTVNRMLFIISIVILGIGLFAYISSNEKNSWVSWIKVAFEDIISYFVQGERSGNIALLAGSFITFPTGIRLWFGTGHRIFGQSGLEKFGLNSDIGYINDIFKGGVIYSLFLYTVIFSDILKRNKDKFYSAMLILFLLLTNYKAEQMNGSAVLLIILLLGFEQTFSQCKDNRVSV